ncbi:MAG: sensor histidine kinase [Panacagrimonas sp.]
MASPSLRKRLIGGLFAPLLVLFGASGLFTFWLSLHFANTVYDGWLYDSVNSLALLVDRAGDHATCELPVAAREIFVWNETDTTFFTVRGEKSGFLARNAELPPVPADASHYRDGFLFDDWMNGRRIHVITLPLDAERAGEHVWVQVAETDLKRKRLARTIFLAVLAPQIALIGAAFFAVNHGVKQGLEPLMQLSRQLGSQDPTSLQPLSEAHVPEEVRPLTQAVNTLLAGFHGVLNSQRKFIADAAHQLRTPLTAIKLNINRALEEDAGAARPILLRLRGSADRAARLANQLLSLARVEAGTQKSQRQWESVDLVAVARESGSEWVPRALDKNIELSLREPAGGARLRGDALMLREALDNLLDNAIKYHPGNGCVRVSIEPGERWRMSVEDDGPGIEPALRTRAFERFYRGDRSGEDGTGLGLAIVSEIAVAHGGTVWLEDGDHGKGLRVVVELPKMEAPRPA